MVLLNSLMWFLQAVLILLVLTFVILLVKICLGISAKYFDEFVTIYFKAKQMNEHIKDRIAGRELVEDKARLALTDGVQQFFIVGLDSEKLEVNQKEHSL
jgi:hypothetical protein